MIDYKLTTLKNGLQVAVVKKEGALFSCNLGIRIGALHEERTQKGICHFVEHMLFKGTKSRDNKKLNEDLEFLGGEYNAFTDYTSTVYAITALKEEITNGLNLLNEMVRFPAFSPEEIEREKGVVLSELKASIDDTETLALNLLNKKAFRKSPLKTDVLGKESSIKSFSKRTLENFHNRYYVPNNAVLVVVSSMEFSLVLKIIRDIFGSWEKKAFERNEIVFEKNRKGTFEAFKDMEQSVVGMLYTFELEEEEKLPLRILNYKLGNSANSILFRELRESRGLAYDVYSDIELTKNIQNLLIYTQVSDDHTLDTVAIIEEIIMDIKENRVITVKDLELMKKVLKTGVLSTIEDTHHICSYILDELMDDEDPLKFQQDIEELEHIRLDDVVKVAQKVLQDPTIFLLRAGD
ncbi:MAG TPA: pitrilysin family protein [Clostridiaceae bacterium]|nr:pitrilysin family protein [Clostridiaceae bacterium]